MREYRFNMNLVKAISKSQHANVTVVATLSQIHPWLDDYTDIVSGKPLSFFQALNPL